MRTVDHFAPIKAAGTTYWLSHHAANRAEEMGIPIPLLPTILATGTTHQAPSKSRYQGRYGVKAGKVALMIDPDAAGPVIVTILWATVAAWRAAEVKAGRNYRGDEWTAYNINAWFGEDA